MPISPSVCDSRGGGQACVRRCGTMFPRRWAMKRLRPFLPAILCIVACEAPSGVGSEAIQTAALSVHSASTGPEWIQLFPTGTPPAPRYSAGNAYDEINDRLILFGGEDLTGPPRPTDVWVLMNASGVGGTPSWVELSPTGGPPLGRETGTVVYDRLSNRIIVHGGCSANCSPALGDTWVLTNANGLGGTPSWIQLPSAPVARAYHSAILDPGNNRMIVFGGNPNASLPESNDVWVLVDANGIGAPSWVQLFPTGAPPAVRSLATLAYDGASNRLIVFGGQRLGIPFNDVWVLTHANGLGGTPAWQQLTPGGAPPAARSWAGTAYDAATKRMTLFGGLDQGTNPYTTFNDVWVMSGADGTGGGPQWTQLAPMGGPPVARFGHSQGYDPLSNLMVVSMGRHDNPVVWPTLFNDV